MDKKLVKSVLAVVLGLSLFMLITSLVGLVAEVALTEDVLGVGGVNEIVVLYMRWFSAAMIFLIVVALVSYALSYFSNSPKFEIISAAISLVVIICAVAFSIVIHRVCDSSSTDMATGIAFIQSLAQVMTAAAIIGAYFTVIAVRHFSKPKNEENVETVGETNDEEV